MSDEKTMITEQELIFLLLGQSVLRENCASLETIDDFLEKNKINQGLLLKEISRQNVDALCYEALTGGASELAISIKEKLKARATQTVLKGYRLLYEVRRITSAFSEKNIKFAVIKGAIAARMYPCPEARKSGDIDLILADENDLDRADKLVVEMGFSRGDKKIHHTEYAHPDGFEVEIHTMLSHPFDKPIDEAMLEISKIGANNIESVSLMEGVSLPAMSLAVRGYHYILHMIQHFTAKGFGVKLLCDWCAYLAYECDEEVAKELTEYLKSCGFYHFTECVTVICHKYMGLTADKTFGFLPTCADDVAVNMLVRDMFAAGEFGDDDSSRMVVLEKTNLGGLIKEFHKQMKFNHPRASKCPLIWPGLYVHTLVVFLNNNKKIRGTSTRDIIKSAKERSREVDSLQLFKAP